YLQKTSAHGKSLQQKAPIMTLEDLRRIGNLLFVKNSAIALKDRTLSSDIAVLRFDELQWMGDYVLANVTRTKTSSATRLDISYSDAFLPTSLISDPFGASDCVFSQLDGAIKREHVSTYINRIHDGVAHWHWTPTSRPISRHTLRDGEMRSKQHQVLTLRYPTSPTARMDS
ncbi:TPA: hypothetical protein N0F65_010196, partial [Lagenidium giganteum]